ncbi:rhamnan synthesis F family protein [Microbacterium sp. zg-YB36]|uniref:rhamnan synthesis F family protein n=1 Tax=Microbacterium sp. zg-YB36 TaxID=2969407 RepID=UPI00214BCA52|nr:rhamnan synthesis F family protein [Microbacterium sp. zg-YB36]MDL5352573.1 rhamnan synthesis F family protein [Microbacterium sp. zg-YB36]
MPTFDIGPREGAPATRFPDGGKRVIFYLFFDHEGVVDDYVPYKLERLRPFAEHIFVIVNGSVNAEGKAKLDAVADTVWERENTGFDVGGYKAALAEFGEERLAEYDELILMNYTWYGPVRPFEPVFERMDAEDVDFWGLTTHGSIKPNPFTHHGELKAHIQSHWIAVRKSMFQSQDWRDYWANMPAMTTYLDSVLKHESVFTDHFATRGWYWDTAFSHEAYSDAHPTFQFAGQLLDEGCPLLKRRPFFHTPVFQDRHSIVPRWFLDKAESYGYSRDLILPNLARTSEPRALYTNAALLEVLPDGHSDYDEGKPQRIVAIVHIFYVDMTEELLGFLSNLPSGFDLIVTTTDEGRAREIRTIIDRRADPKVQKYEVRVLPSNRGRDLSAFFIGAKDVLRSDDYDLVVKIHSKKTVQNLVNNGYYFKRQQLENLLGTSAFASNVVALFQKESKLGVVFPPLVHVGLATMGRGWYGNKPGAKALAKKLGINVPLDDTAPVAPYGAMFIARPEALRKMTDVDWRYSMYSPPSDHTDGSLAHVQERLIAYAAGSHGYYVKSTLTPEHAAISYTSLEYKLNVVGPYVPPYAVDQAHLLPIMGEWGLGGGLGLLKIFFTVYHPRVGRFVLGLYRPARTVYRALRKLVRRDRGAVADA